MGKGIGINDLSKTISGMLNEYSEFVTAETKNAIKTAGKNAAKELQKTSPKKTGDYAKSWKSKVAAETSSTIHVSVYAGNHQ
ncbi:MAG: HK97 gp10 family phage protein, partial [Lachnospiraceae bacterium]